MKRTEIAMIVLVASLTMMLTFTLVQSVFGDMVKQKVQVEKTTPITQDITQPAKRIFNDRAINPTVEVCVETSNEGEAEGGADCNEPALENEDSSPEQQQN